MLDRSPSPSVIDYNRRRVGVEAAKKGRVMMVEKTSNEEEIAAALYESCARMGSVAENMMTFLN